MKGVSEPQTPIENKRNISLAINILKHCLPFFKRLEGYENLTILQRRQFCFNNRMKESVKLEHFNQYKKLSISNLIAEIDGLRDLEQINLNKIILGDSKNRENDISFLNYIQQKIDIAEIVLHHKENCPTK